MLKTLQLSRRILANSGDAMLATTKDWRRGARNGVEMVTVGRAGAGQYNNGRRAAEGGRWHRLWQLTMPCSMQHAANKKAQGIAMNCLGKQTSNRTTCAVQKWLWGGIALGDG
eukprot:1237922-Alexandrium_andersonii.AAC.1